MSDRFRVQTVGAFEYRVIDTCETSAPQPDPGEVCECGVEESARLVAAALNLFVKIKPEDPVLIAYNGQNRLT